MKIKQILNWPNRPDNNWSPWWLIIWRAIWAVPIVIGSLIVAFGAAFVHGPRRNWTRFNDILASACGSVD